MRLGGKKRQRIFFGIRKGGEGLEKPEKKIAQRKALRKNVNPRTKGPGKKGGEPPQGGGKGSLR